MSLLKDIAGGSTRSLTDHLVVDALIAIGFASTAVVQMQGAAESEEGFRDSDGLGVLLILVQTRLLGLRRVAPLGSLAVIAVGVGLHAALGYDHLDAGAGGERVSMVPLGTARGAGAR